MSLKSVLKVLKKSHLGHIMKQTKNGHLKSDRFCAMETRRQMDFDNFHVGQ